MEITQTDNFCRSILTWSDTKKSEVWWLKSPPWAMLDNLDGSGDKVALTTMPQALPLYRVDATMFAWVSDQTYGGKVSYNGKTCLVYQKLLPPDNSAPAFLSKVAPTPLQHTAWIDEKTALPVALDNGNSLFLFTFNPPPTAPLTLPDRFQQKLTNVLNSIPHPKYLGTARSL
jgi:hypothetical protein